MVCAQKRGGERASTFGESLSPAALIWLAIESSVTRRNHDSKFKKGSSETEQTFQLNPQR